MIENKTLFFTGVKSQRLKRKRAKGQPHISCYTSILDRWHWVKSVRQREIRHKCTGRGSTNWPSSTLIQDRDLQSQQEGHSSDLILNARIIRCDSLSAGWANPLQQRGKEPLDLKGALIMDNNRGWGQPGQQTNTMIVSKCQNQP